MEKETVLVVTDYYVARRIPEKPKSLPIDPLTSDEITFLDKTLRKDCLNHYVKIIKSLISQGENEEDLKQEAYRLYKFSLTKFCKSKIRKDNENQDPLDLLTRKFFTLFMYETKAVLGRTNECKSGNRYKNSGNVQGVKSSFTMSKEAFEQLSSEACENQHMSEAGSRLSYHLNGLSSDSMLLIEECFDLVKPTKHNDICYQVERWFINRGIKRGTQLKVLAELADFLDTVKEDVKVLVELDFTNWARELLEEKNYKKPSSFKEAA